MSGDIEHEVCFADAHLLGRGSDGCVWEYFFVGQDLSLSGGAGLRLRP